MNRYIAVRILQAFGVLLGVTVAAFFLIHLTPGDPAQLLLGQRASPEAVARLRHQLGLDRALVVQYWDFVSHAVVLDFGTSIRQHTSVGSLIGTRVGVTLWLTAYATVLAVLLAVPLGVWAAVRRNRPADHVVRVTSMAAFAAPPFLLGLVLVLVVSISLHLVPTSGYGSGILGHFRSLFLPALTLALGLAPILLRTLRQSMIEALGREYVEAAQARGLSRARTIWRHAFRNALMAFVTVLGVNVGYLLGGAVVIENVFALPGLGALLVNSVQVRDFPTVEALAVVFAVLVIVVNLATDIAYASIDPRVRL